MIDRITYFLGNLRDRIIYFINYLDDYTLSFRRRFSLRNYLRVCKAIKELMKLEYKKTFSVNILRAWINDLKHKIQTCPCHMRLGCIKLKPLERHMNINCAHCERTELYRIIINNSFGKKVKKKLIRELEKLLIKKEAASQK